MCVHARNRHEAVVDADAHVTRVSGATVVVSAGNAPMYTSGQVSPAAPTEMGGTLTAVGGVTQREAVR
jgi:hypothetical protein